MAAESTLAFAGLHQLLGPLEFAGTDFQLYTEVLRRFERAAPVLVTVDDVHLWDPTSIAAVSGWNRTLPSLVLPGLPSRAILAEPEVQPNEALAARLEADSAEATRRGGIASAATVLRAAARLSREPERQRRSAAAAYLAWKSGQPELARTLVAEATPERHDPAVAPTLDRLRGLIELGDGDQLSAHDHLLRTTPEPGVCCSWPRPPPTTPGCRCARSPPASPRWPRLSPNTPECSGA